MSYKGSFEIKSRVGIDVYIFLHGLASPSSLSMLHKNRSFESRTDLVFLYLSSFHLVLVSYLAICGGLLSTIILMAAISAHLASSTATWYLSLVWLVDPQGYRDSRKVFEGLSIRFISDQLSSVYKVSL